MVCMPLSARVSLSGCRLRPRLSPPRVIRGGSEGSRGLAGFRGAELSPVLSWGSGTWMHGHATQVSLASALGSYFRITAQGQVHDAPLVRWHRLQHDRPSG